jgi:hypothetical protein
MRAEFNFAPETRGRERKANVPLIVHVIYRLDVGGLENGLVNLINRIPAERFRHAIIVSPTTLSSASGYSAVIYRYSLCTSPQAIVLCCIGSSGGFSGGCADIVHTRNLAALEAQCPALAGCPLLIHREHGRDVNDVDGGNRKYQIWKTHSRRSLIIT